MKKILLIFIISFLVLSCKKEKTELTDEKGTVWISMKIDNTGNLEKPKIMKSENEKLNSEALRLAKLIPNEWGPGKLGSEQKSLRYIILQ